MLRRTIGDLLGEAKASGNLGNTLKVLGRFDEAVVCCQRHLDIARDINDKVRLQDIQKHCLQWYIPYSEDINLQHWHVFPGFVLVRSARLELCTTLGTCTMPKAKVSAGAELSLEISQRRSWWHWGRQLSTMSKCLYSMEYVWLFNHMCPYVLSSSRIAFDCVCIFRANLAIVKELGDRAAQGRTYGNLGNTHYLLGNFRKAVSSHEQVWSNPKLFSSSKRICKVETLINITCVTKMFPCLSFCSACS